MLAYAAQVLQSAKAFLRTLARSGRRHSAAAAAASGAASQDSEREIEEPENSESWSRGTQFPCFTGTVVQILTPEELLEHSAFSCCALLVGGAAEAGVMGIAVRAGGGHALGGGNGRKETALRRSCVISR
jgi:hypothetical protein